MSQRDRWRRRKAQRKIGANAPTAPSATPLPASGGKSLRRVLLIAVAATLIVLVYKMWAAQKTPEPSRDIAKSSPRDPEPDEYDPEEPHGHPPIKKPAPSADPNDFLKEFKDNDPKPSNENTGPALSSAELEKKFETLVALNEQIEALKKRALALGSEPGPAEVRQVLGLMKPYERLRGILDKELRQAKLTRPEDPVVRWLTGELFARAGGQPEEYLPDLLYARSHGVRRPRLLATIALAQLDSNQFEDAYRSAEQSLKENPIDRHVWNAFFRIANSIHRSDEVILKLDSTFPSGLPDWAREPRQSALELRARWQAEEKIRRAEALADDLPRVRFVIEHRRFAKDPDGKPLTTIESTGREEVILELFENEAPLTVANFLDLVEQKFYDGTRFHIALPASWVFGGDPNTKKEDASLHGQGGPGYAIADEFKSPRARNHFRGSLSMVNKGTPGSAGSQFFFNLQPQPEMDGAFTVFGRVMQGQEAIDRITRGRTFKANQDHIGRIIPGDLLVRAEVVRTRAHEYKAVKEPLRP